jgi:nitrite reductase/ring-hydroxylating ferredoxin subunit
MMIAPQSETPPVNHQPTRRATKKLARPRSRAYFGPVPRLPLPGAAALRDGQTLKFEFTRDGIRREGLVARFRGQLVAYENVCRHLPIPLDYGDGRFFDRGGEHFRCQNHGALYEPLTGLCVRGPCEGARLKALRLRQAGAEVWVELDDGPGNGSDRQPNA